MAAEPQVIRGIDWKATFPFVSLFRGFRVAIHPSKLILALGGLLLIFVGGKVLDGIWAPSSRAVPNELGLYEASRLSPTPSADFIQRRDDARKAIVEAHKLRLKMIDKDPEKDTVEDLEWNITHVQLKTALDEINKQFTALPEAERSKADIILARDRDLAKAYAMASEELEMVQTINGVGLFETFYDHELGMLNQVVAAAPNGNWLGTNGVVEAIRSFVVVAPAWAIRHHPVFFTIFFLYFLCIWSVFGGAVARIAAVHVARDEKISIRQALRFSTAKFLSFLSAPIIPLLIVVVVGLVLAIGGFISNVWFLGGPFIVGAFFFLALAAGFVMTLVTLGTIGGINLMYPTVAVEGSDSFDAISRSFSYIYARPWRMAFYTAVSILYGSICYLFVRYFAFLMLTLTHKFVGLFIFTHAENTAASWSVMWPAPTSLWQLSYDINYLALGPGQKAGALLIAMWVHLVIALLGAFAISFYFSSNTIIYLLMRHEVDATETDDVYLEQSDDDFIDSAPAPTAAVTATVVTATVTEAPAPVPPTEAGEPPQT